MIGKIRKSIKKFNLNLDETVVLTEAATGNYVVTPLIAASAGAKKVFAYTRNSVYGSVDDVKRQTYNLANEMGVEDRIEIITSLDNINLEDINVLTNTGFLRPIDSELISKLNSDCVIPLMWEPWEFREGEINIDACAEKGIKIYGTNESDERLKTMDYLGYISLFFLLKYKLTPFSAKVLIVGCEKFVKPITKLLRSNSYCFDLITKYDTYHLLNPTEYNAIIIAEHTNDIEIVGGDNSFIPANQINGNTFVIHIAGNVNFSNATFKHEPRQPAKFGYMSFTTDFIDNMAVIDLHTAGLKVAEGMLEANRRKYKEAAYKEFMEKNYPALAFDDKKYW